MGDGSSRPIKVSISAEGIILGEENLDMDVMRVGRGDDCEIYLDHPTVSRLHAEIRMTAGGEFTLTALSKTNETSINGMDMTWEETVGLDVGDLIVLSDTVHLRVAEGWSLPDPELGSPDIPPEEVDDEAPTSVMTIRGRGKRTPTPAPIVPTSSLPDDYDDYDQTAALAPPARNLLDELDHVRAELANCLRNDQHVLEATRRAEAALRMAKQKLARARKVTADLEAKQRAVEKETAGVEKQLLEQGRQNQALRANKRQRPPGTRRVARGKGSPPPGSPPTRSVKRPPDAGKGKRQPPPTTEKMKVRRAQTPTPPPEGPPPGKLPDDMPRPRRRKRPTGPRKKPPPPRDQRQAPPTTRKMPRSKPKRPPGGRKPRPPEGDD